MNLDQRLQALSNNAPHPLPKPLLTTFESHLDIARLSDVQPETVSWLWKNRIPRGKVTLLVGDPGAGKSFASLAVASSLTRGSHLPDDGDGVREPENVLLWNGEDGLEDTIRPRAETVGVALERLHVIRGTIDGNGRRVPFSLADVASLAEATQTLSEVGLVIIDPLAALLAGIDAHRDTEIRAALQPLVEFAHDARVAVLCILHLRKSEAQRALYRVGGSIGFVGMARSVLLAAEDPEDRRKAIAPLKSNLSAPACPIEYRIDEEGNFWWGAAAEDLDAEHLLRSARPEHAGVLNDAIAFFREELSDGPRSSRDVAEKAQGFGISMRTLARARKKLGIIAERVGGIGSLGEWTLRMP
ncbi:MAG TPA: AAA family ATPase [Candidatus Rubrimentiphilum sp.]|nr:AAA family ATPase [Candidatus Rubrimentiphilum sp.]